MQFLRHLDTLFVEHPFVSSIAFATGARLAYNRTLEAKKRDKPAYSIVAGVCEASVFFAYHTFCALAGDRLVEHVSFLPSIKDGNGFYIDLMVGLAGMAEHLFIVARDREPQQEQDEAARVGAKLKFYERLAQIGVHGVNNALSAAQFFIVPTQYRTVWSSLLYYWSIPYDATPKRK